MSDFDPNFIPTVDLTDGDVEVNDGVFDQYLGDSETVVNDGIGDYFAPGAGTGDLNGLNLSDLTKLFNSSPNLVKLLGAAGIGSLANNILGSGSSGPGGYKGGIPTLTASRQMLPIPATMTNAAGQTVARRPGSGGVTYFSPMQYLKPAKTEAAEDAKVGTQVVAPTAPVETDVMGTMGGPGYDPVTGKMDLGSAGRKYSGTYAMGGMTHGGISSLGGYSDGGRLLRGPGNGTSDDIPATIGDRQPARLSDGEFVIPARIVSELGNGSTEAGARKLYAMMDRIKKARSKAKNIAADTKSDKHLPA
jgi:hypothetical protein